MVVKCGGDGDDCSGLSFPSPKSCLDHLLKEKDDLLHCCYCSSNLGSEMWVLNVKQSKGSPGFCQVVDFHTIGHISACELLLCSHLIKAVYTPSVFNRTLSKAQPLVDMGAHLASSPNAVASKSDVVFSIVGFPSDVRSVLLSPNSGALSSLRPSGVLIDMTTRLWRPIPQLLKAVEQSTLQSAEVIVEQKQGHEDEVGVAAEMR